MPRGESEVRLNNNELMHFSMLDCLEEYVKELKECIKHCCDYSDLEFARIIKLRRCRKQYLKTKGEDTSVVARIPEVKSGTLVYLTKLMNLTAHIDLSKKEFKYVERINEDSDLIVMEDKSDSEDNSGDDSDHD
jgi:hypothetical protein